MNALTNIVTTGLLAATMLGIGTAGTAIAASEEEKQQKVVEQYNYQLVHEINTEDIYRINGEPCTYEEWIEYMNWIQSLPDGEAVIVIDPDEPTDPTIDPEPDPDPQEEVVDQIPIVPVDQSQILYADVPYTYGDTITTTGQCIDWLAVYHGGPTMGQVIGIESAPDTIGGRSNNFPELSTLNIDIQCMYADKTPVEYDGVGIYILQNARVATVRIDTTDYNKYYVTLVCDAVYRPAP